MAGPSGYDAKGAATGRVSLRNGDHTRPGPRAASLSQRRVLLLYGLTIAAPTLLLLWLALQSVHRQRQAIAGLAASNLRLTAEKLAEDLERRAGQSAQACLNDAELARLRLAATEACTPGGGARVQARLGALRQRHPMALHPFVLEDGVMRFPRLDGPPPWSLETNLAREQPGRSLRLAALISEAEGLELSEQRPERALAVYRDSYALATSDALKALALSRVARCLRKLKRLAEAEQTYRSLSDHYGDLCDASHRPYALVAALERDALAREQGVSSMPLLLETRRDLDRRRWELSGDQLDYFVSRLGERGGKAPADEGGYLEHVETARAVEERFRHHGPLRADQSYADSFAHGGRSYEIHYTLVGADRPERVVGFAADLGWVETRLLLECMRELGIAPDLAVKLTAPGRELGHEARATFRALFPFWQLSVSASQASQEASARRALFLFGGSTALILAVLGLGVFLLVRDAARERQMGRLRADFVSGVSHELKTPLTLIRLYGETLLLDEASPEEERREYCRIIVRESERLGHLIDNVLDFSRIDRGEKRYRLEEGGLAPVVRQTVEAYGEYLKRRGFRLETDLASDLPSVRFDADAVVQALVNLVDNAIKYSGESRFVAVRVQARDGQVALEVEDHGIGIPPDEGEKVFQEFYQGRNGLRRGGYGLGLFLVRHIMQAHGGFVELRSEIGTGSRFRLVFPVGSESAAATSAPES